MKFNIDPLSLSGKISKTKQLEHILPSIEKCLLDGFTHLSIVDYLNSGGFDLTYTSYQTMIKRIRKRAKLKVNGNLPVKKIFGKKDENPQRAVEVKPALRIGEPEKYDYNKIVAEARANRVW